jgi:phosphatidylglycerol:prolipoprotein diacylglycerol transferase
MHPELVFDLFGIAFVVKAYVLFSLLGAFAGIAAALPLLKRAGLSIRQSPVLLLFMAAVFLVGARLWNYAINPTAYGSSLHVYTLRLAGLSIYGGILGALCAVWLYSRLIRASVWRLLDALVLPAGLAFAFARVGCYLNGCCSGVATDSHWGVAFPLSTGETELLSRLFSLIGNNNPKIYVFPTQLFELALALLGLALIVWLYFRQRLPHGAAFLLYGIWFSGMRLAILPLRSLPYPTIISRIFYPVFYVFLIITGLMALFLLYKKNRAR